MTDIDIIVNLTFVLLNLGLTCMSLKMLTEYWKDKKK
jgi:hypothetical protein